MDGFIKKILRLRDAHNQTGATKTGEEALEEPGEVPEHLRSKFLQLPHEKREQFLLMTPTQQECNLQPIEGDGSDLD